MWNMTGDIAGQIAHYLENADLVQPGSTVMFSSYNLVHGPCGSTTTPDVVARYQNFMDEMARGIGNFHVIYFLEFDSLITSPCLTPSQLQVRLAELRYAVNALERDPHVVVYLDAGAADAVPAGRIAQMLDQAGVHQAQGFFLNSTHFDWTQTELNYGQRISRMLGGVHFVINTGENGRGPLAPRSRVRSGNEVLCNPAGRGLGPLSVSNGVATQTGYPNADGFLWFSNPGGSGGQCVPGAPPSGQFWPAYAVMLARNWVNRVTGPADAEQSRVHTKHKKKAHKPTHRKQKRVRHRRR
jgi:endoglucanase